MSTPSFKVKRGDLVKVMVGRDKGKTGTVTKVLLDRGMVIVEGVRSVVRFTRPSQACPEGKMAKNLPINISNVAIVDPITNEISRVGYRVNEKGEKERFSKKFGNAIERNYKG
ncbi:MAG: 50S ribosomal protein L24 [Holosporales bacterium]|jgi:large subunit ribosomal protein L24|nr:50S ribosomal protein L24 [Holosporales bacterium]